MDLLAELRNRIYELTLPLNRFIILPRSNSASRAHESITQIGGQYGKGASSIYLGSNTFVFVNTLSRFEAVVAGFLGRLTVEERGYVKRLAFLISYECDLRNGAKNVFREIDETFARLGSAFEGLRSEAVKLGLTIHPTISVAAD